MAEAERYSKWRARGELVRHTAASVGRGLAQARRQHRQPGPGLNSVGYDATSGLSLADIDRVLSAAYQLLGLPVARYDLSVRPSAGEGARQGAARQGAELEHQEDRIFPVTIALTQASHVPTAAVQQPRLFAPTLFRASIVHWEIPRVPLVQRAALPFLDEVWTTSGFVQEAFEAVTAKPVRVIPLPIVEPTGAPGAMRSHLGLTTEYVFGYLFDLASSGERKNPLAVAEAYLRAFPRATGEVRLLLKAVHASLSPHIWEALRRTVEGRDDVLLVDDLWPDDAIGAFFLDIDCYVSLHRAEGFGLTLARAMAAGKPVIATGYSGNLEFMDADNSVLVPSTIVPIGPDPIYPATGSWADPDLDVAADAMRDFAQNPGRGRAIGAAARESILGRRTIQATADWLVANAPGLT